MFIFSLLPCPLTFTLFPYTTLFRSRIVSTRGSCTLAATITADSPIDSEAPCPAGAVSSEPCFPGAAMARGSGIGSARGDVAAERQGVADQANRLEAAAGPANDDRTEAEDAAEDRLVDIDESILGRIFSFGGSIGRHRRSRPCFGSSPACAARGAR